jgi:xylulokinase
VTLVAGIDSSTQSCKVLICDADSGEVVREGRAAHPDGTEIDPAADSTTYRRCRWARSSTGWCA